MRRKKGGKNERKKREKKFITSGNCALRSHLLRDGIGRKKHLAIDLSISLYYNNITCILDLAHTHTSIHMLISYQFYIISRHKQEEIDRKKYIKLFLDGAKYLKFTLKCINNISSRTLQSQICVSIHV